MRVYTIGYKNKTSEDFFTLLNEHNIKKVIDIRLNNTSAFAGFTRKADLRFFLREINNIDYVPLIALAPSKQIQSQFRRTRDFSLYTRHMIDLITQRRIEAQRVSKELIDGVCLLGSEATVDKCHRWLVAEYLRAKLGDLKIEIIHL